MTRISARAGSLATFDRTLQKTYTWLDELSAALSWHDRKRAYAALRITLQSLRDRLPVAEAVDLAAQLPMLVRGFYFEGWNPAAVPVKVLDTADFLAPLHKVLNPEEMSAAEEVARAVFQLLSRHVSAGELDDVVSVLPPELRELFPVPASEAGR